MTKNKHDKPELFDGEEIEEAEIESSTLSSGEDDKEFDPMSREHGPLKHLVDFNFLQYASYVICDRAIPALEDGLKVPANIAAGEYVLSYRWGCEMTSQIWQSCADITIV